MKIISLEEHYRLPAIEDLAKPTDPYMLMKEALTKSGLYKSGPQSGWPEGINDLGAGRIAAMDAAGIDVQVSSPRELSSLPMAASWCEWFDAYV